MSDYSENYLKLQRLMKSYHNATLKWDYELATQLAHELSEETIRLELATIKALKDQWING